MLVRFHCFGRVATRDASTIASMHTDLNRPRIDVGDIRLEQADRREWSGLAGAEWGDARSLHEHLTANTNVIEAAQRAPWDDLLAPGAAVLDAGCGSGWLAGLLSAREGVRRVIALDSSSSLLHDVLPETIELVGGDLTKIEAVCGDLTSLPAEDGALEAVVMSSAFHHADEPDHVLRECRRVLAPGGVVALLNEVPYPPLRFLRDVWATAVAASVNALTTRVTLRKRGHVAANSLLYDDELGDRAMTMAQWCRLLSTHPFRLEVIDTGLPSYKPVFRPRGRRERNLTHFLLRT
jgi:ubiquinone/menaquinone biosynthesis C-methylase UbiE